MLAPMTLSAIWKQVAWRLDCADGDLKRSPILVKIHGPRLARYFGVYVWAMDDVVVISAPLEVVEIVQAHAREQPAATLGDPAFWQTALGARVERIVGPSYQGYVDAEAFRAGPISLEPDGPAARALGPYDKSDLVQLSAACPRQEWADSAIRPDHAPIFALERAGTLVAAASAPDDGPGIASVGVITIHCIGVEDMGQRW